MIAPLPFIKPEGMYFEVYIFLEESQKRFKVWDDLLCFLYGNGYKLLLLRVGLRGKHGATDTTRTTTPRVIVSLYHFHHRRKGLHECENRWQRIWHGWILYGHQYSSRTSWFSYLVLMMCTSLGLLPLGSVHFVNLRGEIGFNPMAPTFSLWSFSLVLLLLSRSIYLRCALLKRRQAVVEEMAQPQNINI